MALSLSPGILLKWPYTEGTVHKIQGSITQHFNGTLYSLQSRTNSPSGAPLIFTLPSGHKRALKEVGFQTGFQNQISPVHQSKAPFGLDWTGGLASPPRTYVYMRHKSVYVLLHAAYVIHFSTSI
jgi:hypothetical protein